MIPLLYNELGRTGIRVSVLCFGSLVLGPAQYNLAPQEARQLLRDAYDFGVNFFDTAELYDTYAQLRSVANLPSVVISSRCYAVTASEMSRSIEAARRGLDRDVLDLFGLHEQESGLTLKGHREALDRLVQEKARGRVKAIAISTHYVECVRSAALLDEVDVIFAILNVEGLGVRGGTREDMEEALHLAKETGKGVYLMKAIGGGHLYREAGRALAYARDFPYKDSVCVGMKDRFELEFAARTLCGETVPERDVPRGTEVAKRLVVEDWCQGCGACVAKCPFKALTLVEGRATVDRRKCMLCGYCARVCPQFCLKVV